MTHAYPEQDVDAQTAPSRQVIALTIDYLLQTAESVTASVGEDLITSVVYLAISRANLRRIFSHPRGRRLYAGMGDPPPDTEREPISVLALARSLDLPYETTRRHVTRLVDKGLCTRLSDGGVLIQVTPEQTENTTIAINQMWRRTLEYVVDLDRLGVSYPTQRRRIAADMRRIGAREASYYTLDLLQLARTTVGMNLQAALLLMALVRANAMHLTRDEQARQAFQTVDQIAPDEARAPITTYALARETGLPYETVRRQVGWLMDAGLCVRQDKGLIVPAEAMRRPELRNSVLANWRETQLFLKALSEFGIGPEQARRMLRTRL